MKKESQISLEFLFAVGVVLLVFILIIAFNLDRKTEVRDLNNEVELKSECFKLSSSITGAYISGSGFGMTTEIEYDASIFAQDRAINMRYNDADVYCAFPVNQVTNIEDQAPNSFDLSKGDITIQNINGVVVVNNVI